MPRSDAIAWAGAVVALLVHTPALAGAAGAPHPDLCTLELSGAVELTAEGRGNVGSVGTDYWLTEEELREALRAMAGIGKAMTDAEKDAEIERQMHEEPRFVMLLVNCDTPAARVHFAASPGTRYAHMPMKPGSYSLVVAGERRPGAVTAGVSLGGTRLNPTAGTLRIESWDLGHIAGVFSLDAVGPFHKLISIRGRFDFPCRAGKACEK